MTLTIQDLDTPAPVLLVTIQFTFYFSYLSIKNHSVTSLRVIVNISNLS